MKNQPIINKNNNYRSFFIVNNNPGPGYYYDVDNNSSFNKIKISIQIIKITFLEVHAIDLDKEQQRDLKKILNQI